MILGKRLLVLLMLTTLPIAGLTGCNDVEEPLSLQQALSVTLEPARDSIIAGEELRIDFIVTNHLPQPAFNVTLEFEAARPSKLVAVSSSRGDCEGSVCRIGSFDDFESVTGQVIATQAPSFDIGTEVRIDAGVSWLMDDSRISSSQGHGTARIVDGELPGGLIWTAEVDASGMSCGDGTRVGSDAVYATFGDEIYSFSRSNGEELWDYRGKDSILDPVLADGSIYFHNWSRDENGDSRYRIYTLDAFQGELRWRHSDNGNIYGRPLIYDESLLFAINEESINGQEKYGNLTAFDPMSGQLKWRYKVGQRITTSPVAFEGRVYFLNTEGNEPYLYSVDPRTGELYRKAPISISPHDTPLLFGGNAFISSGSNTLYSVDLATGEINWSYQVDGKAFRIPKLHEGNQYLPVQYQFSKGPYAMDVLDATTGRLIWRHQSDERLDWVVLDGGSAYITSKRGLISLDASTGTKKWVSSYAFICGPPTVTDGVLYGRALLDKGYIAFAIRGDQGQP